MKIQLYEWHSKNADMVDFAGFKMPVMYSSIKEEHMAVRNAVGLFDVSHMGRMWIKGADAERFLNLLVARDLTKTQTGRASYTYMLNEQGGFLDDIVLERVEENKWLLIWNAGNLKKISLWMNTFKAIINKFSNLDLMFEDITSNSAMFALQGPKAHEVLLTVFKSEIDPPLPWRILSTTIQDNEVIISGTGYTGEAGFEIIVLNTSVEDPSKAIGIWEFLLENGRSYGIRPCGIGARDSLRLEAGLSLYGNDIDEKTNPIQAELFFSPFIHMDKEYFIGKSELIGFSVVRKRVGFIALKKGPSPRSGIKLFKDGQEIGIVTSGGFSPLLNLGIGMGYIEASIKEDGTIIQFEVRNKHYDAKIVQFPLYDTKKYGAKRKM